MAGPFRPPVATMGIGTIALGLHYNCQQRAIGGWIEAPLQEPLRRLRVA